jgi:hypothetical protein
MCLFLILFFTQLYGEITALSRALPTSGKVMELTFNLLPAACPDSLCYDVHVSVSYVILQDANSYRYCIHTQMIRILIMALWEQQLCSVKCLVMLVIVAMRFL